MAELIKDGLPEFSVQTWKYLSSNVLSSVLVQLTQPCTYGRATNLG